MTLRLLLLLLYTVLPASLTCLAWRAKCFFNVIDWYGHKHAIWCRPGCDGSERCPLAVHIREGDPGLRAKFWTHVAVLTMGLIVLGELWTRLAV